MRLRPGDYPDEPEVIPDSEEALAVAIDLRYARREIARLRKLEQKDTALLKAWIEQTGEVIVLSEIGEQITLSRETRNSVLPDKWQAVIDAGWGRQTDYTVLRFQRASGNPNEAEEIGEGVRWSAQP